MYSGFRRALAGTAIAIATFVAAPQASATAITMDDYSALLDSVRDGNTFGFFQGGYSDGAFVTGFFRGVDADGDGVLSSQRVCSSPTCDVRPDRVLIEDGPGQLRLSDDVPDNLLLGPNSNPHLDEITNFVLYFSGNSIVPSFVISGLDALTSYSADDGDAYSGLYYKLGTGVMPYVADQGTCAPIEGLGNNFVWGGGCGLLVASEKDAYIYPSLVGYGVAPIRNGGSFSNGGYNAGAPFASVSGRSLVSYRDVLSGYRSDGDVSYDTLRVFRVSEPNSGSLAALCLLSVIVASVTHRRRASSSRQCGDMARD